MTTRPVRGSWSGLFLLEAARKSSLPRSVSPDKPSHDQDAGREDNRPEHPDGQIAPDAGEFGTLSNTDLGHVIHVVPPVLCARGSAMARAFCGRHHGNMCRHWTSSLGSTVGSRPFFALRRGWFRYFRRFRNHHFPLCLKPVIKVLVVRAAFALPYFVGALPDRSSCSCVMGVSPGRQTPALPARRCLAMVLRVAKGAPSRRR
jgi:hypothetical protein